MMIPFLNKIFSHFLLKFFIFKYQPLCAQKDQTTYIRFKQVLTETEPLPFIIKAQNKHRYCRDLTTFITSYLEHIHLYEYLITEQPETSDNRPYTSSNVISETTFDNDNLERLQHLNDTDEDPFQKNQTYLKKISMKMRLRNN